MGRRAGPGRPWCLEAPPSAAAVPPALVARSGALRCAPRGTRRSRAPTATRRQAIPKAPRGCLWRRGRHERAHAAPGGRRLFEDELKQRSAPLLRACAGRTSCSAAHCHRNAVSCLQGTAPLHRLRSGRRMGGQRTAPQQPEGHVPSPALRRGGRPGATASRGQVHNIGSCRRRVARRAAHGGATGAAEGAHDPRTRSGNRPPRPPPKTRRGPPVATVQVLYTGPQRRTAGRLAGCGCAAQRSALAEEQRAPKAPCASQPLIGADPLFRNATKKATAL